MAKTRTTVNRNLLWDMNRTGDEVNSGNDKEITASLVTISSSSLKNPGMSTNNNKVKFKNHTRKSWAF